MFSGINIWGSDELRALKRLFDYTAVAVAEGKKIVENDNLNQRKRLIEQGGKCDPLYYALQQAVKDQRTDCVKFFLEHKIPCEKGSRVFDALQIVTSLGGIDLLEPLLTCEDFSSFFKIDSEYPAKEEMHDILWWAVSHDKVCIVEWLVKKGIDLAIEICGRQPIHLAAGKGNDAMVTILLQNGSDIEAKERFAFEGRRPLHCAAAKGHRHTMDLLIEHGAKANATTCEWDISKKRTAEDLYQKWERESTVYIKGAKR